MRSRSRPRVTAPHRRVVGAVAVVVVALAAAGAWWALRSSDPAVPETQRLGDVTVEHRWTRDLPRPDDADPSVPEVVVDGDLVVVAQYRRVRAFDAATGEPRWDADAGGRIRGAAGASGVVAVRRRADDGRTDELVLFDAATGERRGSPVPIEPDDSDPVVAGDVVLVRGTRDSGGLQAVDAATGAPRWNQPAATGVPCWTGSAIVTAWRRDPDEPGATASGLAALSTDDGEPTVGPVAADAAARLLCSPEAVVAATDTEATVRDPADLAATTTVRDDFRGLALVDDTTLVADVGERDGDVVRHALVARDAATGDELWRHRTPAVSAHDRVRWQPFGGGLVLANDPADDAGDDRRFARLLDRDGELLGELAVGVGEPSVLAASPDGGPGGLLVVGDATRLVALAAT